MGHRARRNNWIQRTALRRWPRGGEFHEWRCADLPTSALGLSSADLCRCHDPPCGARSFVAVGDLLHCPAFAPLCWRAAKMRGTLEHDMRLRDANWPRDALPKGTDLHGYRLDGFIGRGGFGITYRAVDAIDQVFAIKECFPRQFAVRHGTEVLPADEGDAEPLNDCLRR